MESEEIGTLKKLKDCFDRCDVCNDLTNVSRYGVDFERKNAAGIVESYRWHKITDICKKCHNVFKLLVSIEKSDIEFEIVRSKA